MDDVHQFEGHIACDAETRSEIVVPILINGEVSYREVSPFHTGHVGIELDLGAADAFWDWRKVVAIIDIDCKALTGFDEVSALLLPGF